MPKIKLTRLIAGFYIYVINGKKLKVCQIDDPTGGPYSNKWAIQWPEPDSMRFTEPLPTLSACRERLQMMQDNPQAYDL